MRARYLLSMENKNDYNFWGRAIAGVPANATETEFAKQVAKNVLEIRLADFQGDLQRAKKHTVALTRYDEDFWGDAEWEWRNRQIEDRAEMRAEMARD